MESHPSWSFLLHQKSECTNSIKNFQSNIFQRDVLNGQTSEWEDSNAGLSQSSILRLLFF